MDTWSTGTKAKSQQFTWAIYSILWSRLLQCIYIYNKEYIHLWTENPLKSRLEVPQLLTVDWQLEWSRLGLEKQIWYRSPHGKRFNFQET